MSKTNGKFQPTPEMVAAAETVFMAMAIVSYRKPIVLAYQNRILLAGQWMTAKEFIREGDEPQTILDPEMTYMMSGQDFESYLRACNAAMRELGLTVLRPGNCPLLEAEHTLCQAQHSLIALMEPVTKLALEQVSAMSLEDYRKYVELALRLLAPHANPQRRFGMTMPG